MSSKKRVLVFVFLIVGLASFAAGFSSLRPSSSGDYLDEIRKNVSLYGLIYREIAQKYVEPVAPEKLMKVGINAMLDSVDPYTVLIEKEDDAQLQIMTTGKYGGIGMLIGIKDGLPTVVEPPYEGTPALRAGLREGDQLLEIDGESVRGATVNTVAEKLRGDIGTAVTIKIVREGEPHPIDFRLIRAEIVVKDVVYAGLIDDNVGYIKLTRFSKNAGAEVSDAIRQLRTQGMKALILDLRNNPGGLLEAAVGVADAMLPKGKLIVSTRGRVEGSVQEYYSEHEPVLGDLPLVILVNEYSASASEIVSGAIQDLDRGLIIGRPTFGKGLVQSVIALTRDARLKITTAKYYLPSGRLIQKDHQSDNPEHVDIVFHPDNRAAAADSSEQNTKKVYTTGVGRKVFGGGGIYPEVTVTADTLNRFEETLLRKSMIFNYAVLYANTHENLEQGFAVSDEMVASFKKFLDEKKFTFETGSEIELKRFAEAVAKENIADDIASSLAAISSAIEKNKQHTFEQALGFVKQQLAMEISAKLWGTHAKIEAGFHDDKELQEALKVIKNKEIYLSLLSPKLQIKG